jgi:hypothetical protein
MNFRILEEGVGQNQRILEEKCGRLATLWLPDHPLGPN